MAAISRVRPWSPVLGCIFALVAAFGVTAQHDESTVGLPRAGQFTASEPSVLIADGATRSLDTDRMATTRDAVVAIHTASADPEGGAYGIWAAGEDYKASFHDGFRFVPYLGGGYPENQSFGWRTVELSVGGRAVPVAETAAAWHDGRRFEYRYSNFVEAYDLRAEGVEQSFVLPAHPGSGGDLVVSGAVSTRLSAAVVVDRHAALGFHDDDGNLLIHYGAATAVDARERRLPITTTWDGGRIHLRVPGAWLATAAFPVTIDPLLSRDCSAFWTTVDPPPTEGRVVATDIGRDDLANQIMVAFTRQVSASDSDMWVLLFSSDDATFANRNVVFADLSTTWGNSSPAVAFAGGAADSWIVAFIRDDVGGPGVNGVRYHLHASGDLTQGSSFSSIARPSGSTHGAVVDVGGVQSLSSGDTAFLVYERQDAGLNMDVIGRSVDVSTNTQGAEVLIDTASVGTERTRLRPSINQVAQDATDGWVVAYQEYWNARPGGNDDWDMNLRRITGTGFPTGLVRAPTNSTPDDVHKLSPRVAGANDRYQLGMVVWAEPALTPTTTDVGTDVFCEAFEWTTGDVWSIDGTAIEITDGLVSDRRWRITDGTHDTNTDSHWVWTFESTLSGAQCACSTGFDAGRLERLVAYSPPGVANAFAGAVTFDDDRNEFVLSYATDEGGVTCGPSSSSNHTVYTQRMTHLAAPTPTRFGLSCGPGTIGWVGRNLAGIRAYSLTLDGATPSVPAVLLVSPSAGSLPLDFFGMPGCMLNLDLFTMLDVPGSTNVAGSAAVTFAVPTRPAVVCGDLHWQWAYLAPTLNAAQVGSTQGLKTTFLCP